MDSYPTEPGAAPQHERHSWRRILSLAWFLFVIGLIAYFAVSRRHELSDIGHVLSSADRRWIMVAGGIEIVILILMTRTYEAILLSLGHRVRLRSIMTSYLKGLAVGTVVPFGGPAAIIVFIQSLTQLGVPANDAVFASTLASLSGFASFLVVLLVVLFTLFLTGNLPSVLIAATIILAILFLFAVVMVAVPLRWNTLPSWVTRYLPDWIGRFLVQAHGHHITVKDLRRPFLFSVAVDVSGAAMLYAALLSVGEPTRILPAFAGYQVEMLFNVITPLFQGIGIADLSITVALNQLGVALSQAAAATLVYRLWDLWVPLTIGALIYLFSRGRRSKSG